MLRGSSRRGNHEANHIGNHDNKRFETALSEVARFLPLAKKEKMRIRWRPPKPSGARLEQEIAPTIFASKYKSVLQTELIRILMIKRCIA